MRPLRLYYVLHSFIVSIGAISGGLWRVIIVDRYRAQAQETVIYKQDKEVIRERGYYCNQIQDYKRNNPKYARLFPAYDDKGLGAI